MELGVPFHIVQMIVGHVTAAMTLYYNKPTPEFIRQIIMEKVGNGNLLGDWDDIAADIIAKNRELITTNPAFNGRATPDDLLDGDYTGFVQKPGGMCPLGGNACDIGQEIEVESAANGKTKIIFGPVSGGCGNCRFFCTTPAHLFQHQMVINDLFIRIRSIGKQQAALAERYDELSWEDSGNTRIAQETAELKSQMEDIERQIEPLVREWMNRTQMILTAIEDLDDYVGFLKQHRQTKGALVLLSSSTTEELAPHIEMRMEKTGEFGLARQTLRAAHLQGGIEQCSALTRQQLREFMDRIMVHEDPRYMLVGIHDEKTRDKVAFLMAETMAGVAGTTAIQEALDQGTGLQLDKQKKHELHAWMQNIFKNAKVQGTKATLKSLLPPRLQLIEGSMESEV